MSIETTDGAPPGIKVRTIRKPWHVAGCFTLATLVIQLTSCLIANAATYYVSTTGNDTNVGSETAPWRTIQKAAATLLSKDTVLVQPGDYRENLATVRSGSAGMIRFQGVGSPVINSITADHASNEFSGFLILGAGQQYAVKLNGGADGFRLLNCVVSNATARGLGSYYVKPYSSGYWIQSNKFINGGNIAIGLAGSGHTFINNWLTSTNGFDAMIVMSSNTKIVGNTFTNWSRPAGSSQHTDLIQTFNYPADPIVTTNVTIDGNFMINCLGTQIGNIEDQENLGNVRYWTFRNNVYVNVEGMMSIYARDFYFYNNLFYQCGKNSAAPILFRAGGNGRGDGHNGRVYNNIFFECSSDPSNPGRGWYGNDKTTNFVADYNLVIGSGLGTTKTGYKTGANEAHGLNGLSPSFFSPFLNDYRLRDNSACIGKALSLRPVFDNDYTGRSRGATWDIGPLAYTYSNGALPPLSPPQLRVVNP